MGSLSHDCLLEDILRSIEHRTTTLDFGAAERIVIRCHGAERVPTATRLAQDYFQRGYVLFRYDGPGDAIRAVADLLELGEPFVPALYAAGNGTNFYERGGVNVITAEGGSAGTTHPAFGSRTSLELHTDGTLEPLGHIKTAILYCVTPAEDGGDTTVFHAAAAFAAIARREPGVAAALLAEQALTRRATVGLQPQAAVGPVFACRDGEILSRYSATPRDEWAFDRVADLQQAFEAIGALARCGSPFFAVHTLAAGDGILIANDKVSHGRTGFVDRATAPRRMLRALFVTRPPESLPQRCAR